MYHLDALGQGAEVARGMFRNGAAALKSVGGGVAPGPVEIRD